MSPVGRRAPPRSGRSPTRSTSAFASPSTVGVHEVLARAEPDPTLTQTPSSETATSRGMPRSATSPEIAPLLGSSRTSRRRGPSTTHTAPAPTATGPMPAPTRNGRPAPAPGRVDPGDGPERRIGHPYPALAGGDGGYVGAGHVDRDARGRAALGDREQGAVGGQDPGAVGRRGDRQRRERQHAHHLLAARIDLYHGAVARDRPHRGARQREPVGRDGRDGSPARGQHGSPPNRVRTRVEVREGPGDGRERLSRSLAPLGDPERAVAGRDVGGHCAGGERPRAAPPRRHLGHRLAVGVDHPGAVARGRQARRGSVERHGSHHVEAVGIDANDPAAAQLHRSAGGVVAA